MGLYIPVRLNRAKPTVPDRTAIRSPMSHRFPTLFSLRSAAPTGITSDSSDLELGDLKLGDLKLGDLGLGDLG